MTDLTWWEEYKVALPEMENEGWAIQHFEVKETSWKRTYYALQGRPVYPGNYTRLIRKSGGAGDLVMSDTPAEIRDHLEIIHAARGRVLIHGLGLGMCLGAVLKNAEVTHVDVVELSQDLIDLVGPHYQDPRVTIHQGDALTFKFPAGTRWNVVWHDIWDTICADNWEDMKKLRRRYGHRCDWQECWAGHHVQRLVREERSWR